MVFNVIKFMVSGYVKFVVSFVNDELYFVVEDMGIGIDEDVWVCIF